MIDHLPECFIDPNPLVKECRICDALRACEQRAYSEAAEEMMRGTIQLENTRIRDEGYTAGLDDAWEAVERASSLLQPLGPALAAIDALKEKP